MRTSVRRAMEPFYRQVGYVYLLYTLLLLLYTLLPIEWSCVHAVSLCCRHGPTLQCGGLQLSPHVPQGVFTFFRNREYHRATPSLTADGPMGCLRQAREGRGLLLCVLPYCLCSPFLIYFPTSLNISFPESLAILLPITLH